MDNERKHIIISEIKHWKQSKLIPARYCDFLIALYSRGEEIDTENVKTTLPLLSNDKRKLNKSILYLILLTTLCTVSLFVIENYSAIVLGLSAVILISLLFYATRSAAKKSGVSPFNYIASAFILLSISLKFWTMNFEENIMILIALLLINSVIWIIMGKYLNLIYFKISGVVCVVLVAIFVVVQF